MQHDPVDVLRAGRSARRDRSPRSPAVWKNSSISRGDTTSGRSAGHVVAGQAGREQADRALLVAPRPLEDLEGGTVEVDRVDGVGRRAACRSATVVRGTVAIGGRRPGQADRPGEVGGHLRLGLVGELAAADQAAVGDELRRRRGRNVAVIVSVRGSSSVELERREELDVVDLERRASPAAAAGPPLRTPRSPSRRAAPACPRSGGRRGRAAPTGRGSVSTTSPSCTPIATTRPTIGPAAAVVEARRVDAAVLGPLRRPARRGGRRRRSRRGWRPRSAHGGSSGCPPPAAASRCRPAPSSSGSSLATPSRCRPMRSSR